jgi:hypothetical protein
MRRLGGGSTDQDAVTRYYFALGGFLAETLED